MSEKYNTCYCTKMYIGKNDPMKKENFILRGIEKKSFVISIDIYVLFVLEEIKCLYLAFIIQEVCIILIR